MYRHKDNILLMVYGGALPQHQPAIDGRVWSRDSLSSMSTPPNRPIDATGLIPISAASLSTRLIGDLTPQPNFIGAVLAELVPFAVASPAADVAWLIAPLLPTPRSSSVSSSSSAAGATPVPSPVKKKSRTSANAQSPPKLLPMVVVDSKRTSTNSLNRPLFVDAINIEQRPTATQLVLTTEKRFLINFIDSECPFCEKRSLNCTDVSAEGSVRTAKAQCHDCGERCELTRTGGNKKINDGGAKKRSVGSVELLHCALFGRVRRQLSVHRSRPIVNVNADGTGVDGVTFC